MCISPYYHSAVSQKYELTQTSALNNIDNEVCFSLFAGLTALLPDVHAEIVAQDMDQYGCYTCTLCKRRIRNKHHIYRHLRTHTGLKNYLCIICGKQFSRQDTLSRHAKKCRLPTPPDPKYFKSSETEMSLNIDDSYNPESQQ